MEEWKSTAPSSHCAHVLVHMRGGWICVTSTCLLFYFTIFIIVHSLFRVSRHFELTLFSSDLVYRSLVLKDGSNV